MTNGQYETVLSRKEIKKFLGSKFTEKQKLIYNNSDLMTKKIIDVFANMHAKEENLHELTAEFVRKTIGLKGPCDDLLNSLVENGLLFMQKMHFKDGPMKILYKLDI